MPQHCSACDRTDPHLHPLDEYRFGERVVTMRELGDPDPGPLDDNWPWIKQAGIVMFWECDPCPWWHKLPVIRRLVHDPLP